jgi:hypothetical protein
MNDENSLPSIPSLPIERIPLTQAAGDFITLVFALSNGFIGAYIIPGIATILEKKNYLSIRSEKPLSDEMMISIANHIFGVPCSFKHETEGEITRIWRLKSDLSDLSEEEYQ